MADKDLEMYVKISVKSDDKAMRDFADKMADAGKTIDKTAQSTQGLSGTLKGLAAALGGLAILNKVTGWLKEGIIEYIAEERAVRALSNMIKQFQPDIAGLSDKLEEHSKKLKQVGMDEGVFYQSIRELILLTKDYDNAVRITTLAWNIAQATGRDYAEVVDILRGLVANNPRSLKQAYRELGAEGETAQQKLDNLYSKFDGYSQKLKDHQTEVERLKNMWSDFWKTLAGWIVTAADYWRDFHNNVMGKTYDFLIKISSYLPQGLNVTQTLMAMKQKWQEIAFEEKGGLQGLGAPSVAGKTSVAETATALETATTQAIELKSNIDEIIKAVDKLITLQRGKKQQELFVIDIPLNEELAKWNDFWDEVQRAATRGFQGMSVEQLAITKKQLQQMKSAYQKYQHDVTAIEIAITKIKMREALTAAKTAIDALKGVVAAHTAVGKALVVLDAVVAFANTFAAATDAMKSTPGDVWVKLAAYATVVATGLAGVMQIQQAFSKQKTYSAAGGFDIPSNINPVVQAHASEMVLPADIANAFRSLVNAGYNQMTTNNYGGNTHININALTGAYALREVSKKIQIGKRLYTNLKVGGA